MTHDSIRTAIDRKAKEVMVPVSLASLMALMEERDALERELRTERELAQISRDADGFKTLEVKAVECTCTDPPTVYEFTTVEHPNGSIEGGWDIQDGDEMVTVNLSPSEQGAVDAIIVNVSESGEITGPVAQMYPKVADFSQDIERAVCGSRQPPGQVVESPAPVLVDKPFVSDKGVGKPSQTVVPWSSKLTPNQTALIIRMLADGAKGITAAAHARCTFQQVGGVVNAYRHQIEALEGTTGTDAKEKFLDSLYRQMLARWQAAGNDPAIQPELPLPNKTLSEAAKPDKPTKGKAGNL